MFLGVTTNGSQETRIWLSAARWASGSNTFSTLGTGVGKVIWHRNYFSTLNDTIQVQPVGVISSNAVGRFNTYKFGDIVNQVAGSQSKETTIGTFEYSATKPTTAGKFYFASNKLYLTWNGNLQETTLRQYLSDGQRFSLGSWTFAVIDGLAKGTIAQGGYNIDVATISGSAPTSGTQTLKVFGKFLAWSDTTARQTEHFNAANSMLQAGTNVTKTANSVAETISLSVTFPDGNSQQKGLVETATNSEMNSGLSTSLVATPSGVRYVTGARASSAELLAGTETGVRRYSPADIKSMAETFGGSGGSWEYVSSHTLSTTGWPSANGTSASINISVH